MCKSTFGWTLNDDHSMFTCYNSFSYFWENGQIFRWWRSSLRKDLERSECVHVWSMWQLGLCEWTLKSGWRWCWWGGGGGKEWRMCLLQLHLHHSHNHLNFASTSACIEKRATWRNDWTIRFFAWDSRRDSQELHLVEHHIFRQTLKRREREEDWEIILVPFLSFFFFLFFSILTNCHSRETQSSVPIVIIKSGTVWQAQPAALTTTLCKVDTTVSLSLSPTTSTFDLFLLSLGYQLLQSSQVASHLASMIVPKWSDW